MLTPRLLRPLGLRPGGPTPHLSAASGLARVASRLYVVADDEHALGCFGSTGQAPGRLLRLLGGDLPHEPEARKAAKPDLEALAWLPVLAGMPHGALLALGSGSRAHRQRGVLWATGPRGAVRGAPRVVDLAPLYAPLGRRLGMLNIEGAFIANGALVLLQRARRSAPLSASIHFDAAAVGAWLAGTAAAPAPRRITEHALGALDGVVLGFTDGVALPGGGWLYSAAAEDTDDPYLDGGCTGSVLGWVDAAGVPAGQWRLAGSHKVEGLALAAGASARSVLMVTDPDDRAQPAQLLAAELPMGVSPRSRSPGSR